MRDKLIHIATESIKAAEMRQGCTNHTYYAEKLADQIIALLPEILEGLTVLDDDGIEESISEFCSELEGHRMFLRELVKAQLQHTKEEIERRLK